VVCISLQNKKVSYVGITNKKGSTTNDVVVDLVYIYDINLNKEKETVTNGR